MIAYLCWINLIEMYLNFQHFFLNSHTQTIDYSIKMLKYQVIMAYFLW